MYLRNFADERSMLRVAHRDNVNRTFLSTVNRACNEVGFYEWRPGLTADEVDDPEVLDPEHIEGLLSVFEGRAAAPIKRILSSGQPPRTAQDRYDLVHFVALQAARGRRFREDLSQVATWATRRSVRESIQAEKAAEWLRARGEPHGPQDVEAFVDRVLGPDGLTLRPDQTFAIQQALAFAYLRLAPRLWTRPWHVVRFDEPALLTSDEPVVAWHSEDEPVTAVTAPVVWLPLGRQSLLEIRGDGAQGPDGTRVADLHDARRVNALVAAQAERWIMHHPDDHDLLADIDVGPRTRWTEEVLDTRITGD
ncbi:Protein of unknown function, partial [Blastococcus aggregatus]